MRNRSGIASGGDDVESVSLGEIAGDSHRKRRSCGGRYGICGIHGAGRRSARATAERDRTAIGVDCGERAIEGSGRVHSRSKRRVRNPQAVVGRSINDKSYDLCFRGLSGNGGVYRNWKCSGRSHRAGGDC